MAITVIYLNVVLRVRTDNQWSINSANKKAQLIARPFYYLTMFTYEV
jgi:hypothetical protein